MGKRGGHILLDEAHITGWGVYHWMGHITWWQFGEGGLVGHTEGRRLRDEWYF